MSSIVSSGAAAILEKYAALNNGIDECRRDAIHISAQLEAIRMEIADLAFKCDEMNDQMEQTKFEKKQLENELKEAKLKRSNLERSKEDALAAYDKAKRELQFAQSLREEDRLQFMGECKKYREACKRIRLSALVAAGSSGAGEGIVHNSHAFHILPPEIDECSYCSDDESPSLQETFPHIEYTNERDSHHDDASTMSESVLNAVNSPNPQPVKRKTLNKSQKMEEKDPEIKVAKGKEAHALKQFLQAKRELDQAIAERDERSLKAEDRMDKLEQQQAQLERIKTDVESMEMELIALERNSKEARLMSEGFAKDINRRKALRRDSDGNDQMKRVQSSSIPRSDNVQSRSNVRATSQPARTQATTTDRADSGQNSNPYKKTAAESSTTNQPSHKNQSSVRQQQQNTMERQHPHRAGKIRVDKQFQVHLQVSALSDDDDTSSSSSDESILHKNQRKITAYSSKGQSKSRTGQSNSRTGQSSKENKSNHEGRHRKSSHLLDSDDDEDDRELMGCVPFA